MAEESADRKNDESRCEKNDCVGGVVSQSGVGGGGGPAV